MALQFVYITAGSLKEARTLAKDLVDSGLVACVNILGPIESIYRWQEKLQSGQEVAMIAKTKKSQLKKLVERVRQKHSYECPCIVSWKIDSGFQPFLNWVDQESQGKRNAAKKKSKKKKSS